MMLKYTQPALPTFCLVVVLVLQNGGDVFSAQALATPVSRSRKSQRKRNVRSSVGGGGFAKKKVAAADSAPPPRIIIDDKTEDDEIAKLAVSKLFSVCSHIQNPQLYQPKWANACKHQSTAKGDKRRLVTTRKVDRGQILTLLPIHALGLRTLHQNNDDTEFVAYDHNEDGDLFQQDNNQRAGLRIKWNIPLDEGQPAYSVIGKKSQHVLFSMCLPEKEEVPGWLGGIINSGTDSNCITLPLPGAAPLCAIVATRDINEGDELMQGVQSQKPNVVEELNSILMKEYTREISSLRMHIEMAIETACDAASSSVSETEDHAPSEPLGPFHQINQRYPGLKQIHHDPDIYAIENFLSEDECDGVIAKAAPHLQPCLVNNEKNGRAEQDPARSSMNTNLPQAEVPTIMQKITDMVSCDPGQIEILQVLRYRNGQEFKPHTDGFSGPYSACGFERSARLATVFCYLNDVPRGGSTYFPALDLDVRPRRGTAVVHFPADVRMREDRRTLHQGAPAAEGNDKWLLTTWMWMTERTVDEYAESKLPSLSSDII